MNIWWYSLYMTFSIFCSCSCTPHVLIPIPPHVIRPPEQTFPINLLNSREHSGRMLLAATSYEVNRPEPFILREFSTLWNMSPVWQQCRFQLCNYGNYKDFMNHCEATTYIASTSTSKQSKLTPLVKTRPSTTPKPVMARTSSKLAAAITRVGIPLSTPRPSSWSHSMLGTTTAGDTAPSTNLGKSGDDGQERIVHLPS